MSRRLNVAILAVALGAAALALTACGASGMVQTSAAMQLPESSPAGMAMFGRTVSSGATVPTDPDGVIRQTGAGSVALTFDDGPDASTPQILALLRQYGVKATFCVIGLNVKANPGLLQAIVRDGHTLCNHTWQHDTALGRRSADMIRADLQRTNDEIHKAAPGVPVRYFRHPAGNFTPTAVQVARELGMTSLGWNVDPRDWDTKTYQPGTPLTNQIVSVIQQNCAPGAIVLSHDGGGDRSSTVAAYRTLLPYLLDRYPLIALPT